MPRKTSLGNILEATESCASAPTESHTPEHHGGVTTTSTSSVAVGASVPLNTERLVQSRSVRIAPVSRYDIGNTSASASANESASSTTSTSNARQRRVSFDEQQQRRQQEIEVLHELDEAGYSVLRRRASSDSISELRAATPTTASAPRRRQSKRSKNSAGSTSADASSGVARRASDAAAQLPHHYRQQQQASSPQQQKRYGKKDTRTQQNQQQQDHQQRRRGASSSNGNAATSRLRRANVGAASPPATTTRERMEQGAGSSALEDSAEAESPWLIPPPAPSFTSLALGVSSRIGSTIDSATAMPSLWTGSALGGASSPPLLTTPTKVAPPLVGAMRPDEDPHEAWANAAAKQAAAGEANPLSSSSSSSSPLALELELELTEAIGALVTDSPAPHILSSPTQRADMTLDKALMDPPAPAAPASAPAFATAPASPGALDGDDDRDSENDDDGKKMVMRNWIGWDKSAKQDL